MEQLLVSTREGFAAIGVGSTKGYELLASGELELVKIGRASRIPADSLRNYVARLRNERAAP